MIRNYLSLPVQHILSEELYWRTTTHFYPSSCLELSQVIRHFSCLESDTGEIHMLTPAASSKRDFLDLPSHPVRRTGELRKRWSNTLCWLTGDRVILDVPSLARRSRILLQYSDLSRRTQISQPGAVQLPWISIVEHWWRLWRRTWSSGPTGILFTKASSPKIFLPVWTSLTGSFS